MKNIKFFALLLSVAMIFASVSFISCKDNTEEDVTDTTTESSTTEESAPDTVVDSTTETEKETEPEVEPEGPYETDTMTSSECFNFASDEFLTLIGGLKDGFFPEIFDSESEVDGGSLKISSEKASIFGQTLFEKSFVASGSYAKNENGLVSEGTLTGETPLGYQLYITPDGQLCVRFPSVDENKFIGIDTGELFDFGEGGDSSSSTDSVDQMASLTRHTLLSLMICPHRLHRC